MRDWELHLGSADEMLEEDEQDMELLPDAGRLPPLRREQPVVDHRDEGPLLHPETVLLLHERNGFQLDPRPREVRILDRVRRDSEVRLQGGPGLALAATGLEAEKSAPGMSPSTSPGSSWARSRMSCSEAVL